jgi:hypothetical protein
MHYVVNPIWCGFDFRGNRRSNMKTFSAVAVGLVFFSCAAAADPSCQEQATSKKLAGAALNSFMTKCQKDATVSCQKSSAGKKLAGAAKTSFENKCVKDAIGKS